MSLLIRGIVEQLIPEWKPRNILITVTLLSVVALYMFGRASENAPAASTEIAAPQNGAEQSVTFRDELSGEQLTDGAQESQLASGQDSAPLSDGSSAFEPALADADLQVVPQPARDENDASSVLVDSYRSTDNIATLLESNAQSTSLLDPELDLQRLVIPAIDLDVTVTELGWYTSTDEEGLIFSEWDVADNAAGWHKDSARPGDGGNVVLSGHNNILGAVFRELDQLDSGDEALVYAGERVYSYKIESVMVVPETFASEEQRTENAQWIEQFDDDRITLVSCWPRDDNSHRIIVVGYATGLN